LSAETSLLTFGIGPVHTFIAQARRIADVWAGSYLLSHLVRQAMGVIRQDPDERAQLIFPFVPKGDPIPDGVPNRFVCQVPAGREDATAIQMKEEVERVWNLIVNQARGTLRDYGIVPSTEIWGGEGLSRQTDRLLQISWSWVPERDGYAQAALEGAERYAATRLFRPFPQAAETGEKCAICGERTALPDGHRHQVEAAWRKAEEKARERKDGADRFLRFGQSRLCLVCATKRFFTYVEERRRSRFVALDEFQPAEDEPYIAVVKLDGDRMGALLSLGPDAVVDGDLKRFHREVSKALTEFARDLGSESSPELNLEVLGGYEPVGRNRPQLLYAGGDDALFVCDPRDALPIAALLRRRYDEKFTVARECLLHEEDRARLTMSGAIYFAHSGHPAGLLLHDLERLLKEVAKEKGGRDALAIRLEKRGGAPIDVILPWQADKTTGLDWIDEMKRLVNLLREGGLSSSQTFSLRLEERTLREVFARDEERWKAWLAERLTRNLGTVAGAQDLARRLTPFFIHDKAGALRVARFLGHEAERGGNRP